jgi:hypothetical protein
MTSIYVVPCHSWNRAMASFNNYYKEEEGFIEAHVYIITIYTSSSLVFQSKELQTEPSLNNLKI